MRKDTVFSLVVVSSLRSGYLCAATSSLLRSRAVETLRSDRPVGSTKCVLVMPSALAFAFMAAIKAA
ncbi:hypothetical protein D3C81_1774680 [compost metagenome]